MKKICQQCGVEFNAMRSKIKYCSPSCYSVARNTNYYLLKENHAILIVTSKKYGKYKFIIDREDVQLCKKYIWTIAKHNKKHKDLIYLNNSKNRIRLHRLIMNCPDGLDVDHIDRNTFNNLKSNLRICSREENSKNVGISKRNKTGYKNIHYVEKDKMFRVSIYRDGRNIMHRYFKNIKDAIIARDEFFKTHPQYTLIE